jgi:hypothetical protein
MIFALADFVNVEGMNSSWLAAELGAMSSRPGAVADGNDELFPANLNKPLGHKCVLTLRKKFSIKALFRRRRNQ